MKECVLLQKQLQWPVRKWSGGEGLNNHWVCKWCCWASYAMRIPLYENLGVQKWKGMQTIQNHCCFVDVGKWEYILWVCSPSLLVMWKSICMQLFCIQPRSWWGWIYGRWYAVNGRTLFPLHVWNAWKEVCAKHNNMLFCQHQTLLHKSWIF